MPALGRGQILEQTLIRNRLLVPFLVLAKNYCNISGWSYINKSPRGFLEKASEPLHSDHFIVERNIKISARFCSSKPRSSGIGIMLEPSDFFDTISEFGMTC